MDTGGFQGPQKTESLKIALLRWFLAGLAVVLIVRHFLCEPILVVGQSMLPTLRSGRIAFVNKTAYLWHGPRRGDIVAASNGREVMVKRIVGLPGEEISAKGGVFFVNGVALQESYVQCHAEWNVSSGRLLAGHFVLAGDNRADTVIVVVTRDRIVGRLVD